MRWILAVALVVIGAAYALQRGVYVGSAIEERDGYYSLVCDYLLPSGIYRLDTGGYNTPEDASAGRYCVLFLN